MGSAKTANHSEGGAVPLPATALRYLPSHSRSYRTIPSVPLPLIIPKNVVGLQERRTIAGSTARCGCKFRHVSKFSVASRGFHCSSNAFELNNSIGLNHGKTRVFNIIYLLPLNSLFNSRCLPPFKMLKLYIVRRYVSL